MLNKTLFFSLFALAACATARGQAAYDNLTVNPIYAYSNGTSVGQSFITGNSVLTLSNVVFPQVGGAAGGGSGSFSDAYTSGETFSLYTDGTVTGADGASHDGPGTRVLTAIFSLNHNYTVSSGAAGDPGGYTTATLLAPVLLTANTRYWLILGVPTNAPTGTNVFWDYADMGVVYPYHFTSTGAAGLPATDGSFELNNPSAPGYVFYNYSDGPQELIINAVPEPSTLALLAVASVSALVVARRRRAANAA